ncbi:hypothetical protein PMAYCL1PPCAC_25552, partial [Pristionchus mayeri]
ILSGHDKVTVEFRMRILRIERATSNEETLPPIMSGTTTSRATSIADLGIFAAPNDMTNVILKIG